MTISLSNDIVIFRSSFDSTCKRITETKLDLGFCELLAQLIGHLKDHPLLKEFLSKLKNQSDEQEKVHNFAALEALEDKWSKLWKYHSHTLKHRKQLVHIKQIVTAPNAVNFSPLYYRVLFSMNEFCYHSSFCRSMAKASIYFRAASTDLSLDLTWLEQINSAEDRYFIERKIHHDRFDNHLELNKLHHKIPHLEIQQNQIIPFRRSVEHLIQALSSKIGEVEKRFCIPGKNTAEKRKNMRIMAEINPVYCWKLMRFLYDCYNFEDSFSIRVEPLKGKWESIRTTAWQLALDRCENEVMRGAKMALEQKLFTDPPYYIDSFVNVEHQFQRKDFDEYLKSLQNHIHNQLFILESQLKQSEMAVSLAKNSEDLVSMLPGTQKWNFVVDLASKYWKNNLWANHDDVFDDYCRKCPSSKLLSRPRWDQIIRERKLDPRPKEAKKRGKGKKTLQN